MSVENESCKDMERVVYNKENILQVVFPDHEDETWDLSEKVPLIVNEIEKLRLDLKKYLSENVAVQEIAEESEGLCDEGQRLIEELQVCEHLVEHETMAAILRSVQDHDAIAHELEKVNYSLNIVYDVVHCGKYFKEYDEYRRTENFTVAAERLIDIKDFLTTPADGFSSLTMYDALKTSVELHWEELLQELGRRWSAVLSWELREDQRSSLVTIQINLSDVRSHIDVLLALNLCKQLLPKVSEFAQFLLKQVLIPIVQHETELINKTPELITLEIIRGRKPCYEEVLMKAGQVIDLLSCRLNIDVQAKDSIMTLIGKEIGAEFAGILVEDCLAHTIPKDVSQLNSYKEVVVTVEAFQEKLIEVGFFSKQTSIMYFASDLDESFAKEISQRFLSEARTIMLRDLSESICVGVENILPDEDIDDALEPGLKDALLILHETLPKNLFSFPRCMISKSTGDLLEVLDTMIEQAAECSDLAAKRLYKTSRLIFDLYEAVVPYHHENFLLTIPQYVALFHNNCMYLAHNLLMLGEKWTMRLDGKTIDYPISFLDLVPKMRNLAYKHLTIHLQQQRKQILDNIRSSDLNCIVVKDVLGENAEQAIRQCLRQLQLLKNVSSDVFPPNVFTKLMACLVNMFVEEIIHRVCTVEDISAEMATQLTEIYTIVVKKAPKFFKNEAHISGHVKSWVKLQELILVLGGSLKDIEKRWDDGTGPLAVHFSIEELRSLVKALFQNTQFRANLLAKIK